LLECLRYDDCYYLPQESCGKKVLIRIGRPLEVSDDAIPLIAAHIAGERHVHSQSDWLAIQRWVGDVLKPDNCCSEGSTGDAFRLE
jgi:hypothetical protein